MTFEEFAVAGNRRWLAVVTAMSGGDRGLAEDVVQEVLLRIHSRWDLIGSMAHRDAYVYRMLVNELHASRRKWGRLIPMAAVPDDGSHADHAARLDLRDELLRHLIELPHRQRTVIAMRYLADMSDGQIAQALGCREASVRSCASRALASLRVTTALNPQATTERSAT